MTVKEAIKNLDIVVSNSRMTRPEHEALLESLKTISVTCEEVDELKKENSELQAKLGAKE
jgi:hypothetical protein